MNAAAVMAGARWMAVTSLALIAGIQVIRNASPVGWFKGHSAEALSQLPFTDRDGIILIKENSMKQKSKTRKRKNTTATKPKLRGKDGKVIRGAMATNLHFSQHANVVGNKGGEASFTLQNYDKLHAQERAAAQQKQKETEK